MRSHPELLCYFHVRSEDLKFLAYNFQTEKPGLFSFSEYSGFLTSTLAASFARAS